ncbi:adenylyltransferase/cytidyltransferase family protein [Pseudomonadota bacterium]
MFNREQKENKQKRVVMAFGTFDFFHAGHEFYLSKAKELGDYLIVIISRDQTAKQIKGDFPVHNERKRAKTVKQSGFPDKVIIGDHKNKYKVIEKFRPDVIALGYDQFVFTQKLNKTLIDLRLNTVIKRMDAHFPQIYKSSLVKRSLQNDNEILTVKHANATAKT